MPQNLHRIMRRGLLAAGGTLLAGAVARKYLMRAQAEPADQSNAEPAGQSQAEPADQTHAEPPPGPMPQPIDSLKARPPATLPPLAFTAADGAPLSLASYAGRGVVLNFWATWCVPCVSEMPALDALSRALAAQGILVLPVSLDHGGADAVRPFFAQHGIRSLPVLLDPHAATMALLKLDGIPTTLVIDRQGREVARVQGPVQWDAADAPSRIARLIG